MALRKYHTMNNTRNAIMLGVVLTVGMVGMIGILPNTQGNVTSQEEKSDAASITGHIIVTAYDADGNIKAYRQTDNLIVDSGKNCAPVLLFGATSPTSCYSANAVGSAYNIIAVSTITTDPAATDTALTGQITTNGLAKAAASSVTVTIPALLGTSTSSETTLTKAFSVTGSSTVGSAGLLNNDATVKMFAGKSFTPISVINGDTLTVTWKIQLNQ